MEAVLEGNKREQEELKETLEARRVELEKLQVVVGSDKIGEPDVVQLLKNLNDQPLPVDAVTDPVLEVADGNGGWTRVELLPYDPEANADVLAPGLDMPLGAHSATNLQYRFDAATGTLWNARLTMGNVTWTGNLNL